ncbi:MAG: hypothetical protein Q8O10_07700 [candidate division Zixibacteria bacterium]|nr:hypothetical protein [candidate division Zixibacteria bacterium]
MTTYISLQVRGPGGHRESKKGTDIATVRENEKRGSISIREGSK